jgi:CP family cyanate transporter-like MFS transporter
VRIRHEVTDRSGRRGPVLLTVLGVILVSLNLRSAVTSLGALLPEVSQGVGLSPTLAGVVTMLPTLSFAVAGSFAPWLSRQFSPARILVVAMGMLAANLVVRAVTDMVWVFLVATALALAGIAVANVLMPALVKEHFPDRIGLLTGVYTMCMLFGASTAAAAAVPIAQWAGTWRVGLGGWALLAAVALLAWLPAAVRRGSPLRIGVASTGGEPISGAAGGSAAGVPQPGAPAAAVPVARVPPAGESRIGGGAGRRGAERVRPVRTSLGWAMALFFGCQSLTAYAVMGWLPQLFRDAGYSSATAGLLLATLIAIGVPVAFVTPTLAARIPDLRPVVVALAGAACVGFLGLAVAPRGLAVLWVLILTAGQAAFPLGLTMIGLRARTPQGTVALSAFTQSTGYLIAGFGPLVVGMLYGATGGWVLPLGFLIAITVVHAGAGVVAGRPRFIEDE